MQFRLRTLMILITVGLCHALADDNEDKWEAFKRRMMPKTGTTVTVTGELRVGKLAEYIATADGGGIHMMSSDVAKVNDLARLMKKRLTVTGTLQYREARPPSRPGVSGIPEYFYFDIETARVRMNGER